MQTEDTAKLVRAALKEAFPGAKFSVRTATYSGGASLTVKWTDGPAVDQVKGVASRFEGGYFDAMTDYKGGYEHRFQGQTVNFLADFIQYEMLNTPAPTPAPMTA